MVKIICINICLFLLIVSCQETREDKIAKYLKSKNIEGNVSIGILNPNHCGSCTDYSIDWLCSKRNISNDKIILTTGELNQNYKNKLSDNNFSFQTADAEDLARVGVTLAVCTFIEMKNNEIISIKTVK